MKWPNINYQEGADGMLEPAVEYPTQPAGSVGKYGGMRLNYLKEHRPATYSRLRLEGTLKQHLLEVDAEAKTDGGSADRGAGEAYPAPDKAADPLAWVGHMNSLKAQARGDRPQHIDLRPDGGRNARGSGEGTDEEPDTSAGSFFVAEQLTFF